MGINKLLRENNNMHSSERSVDISTVTTITFTILFSKMVSVVKLVGKYDTDHGRVDHLSFSDYLN